MANRFFNKICIVYGNTNAAQGRFKHITNNKEMNYEWFNSESPETWDFVTTSNIKIYYYPFINDVVNLFKTLSDKIIDAETMDKTYDQYIEN